MPKPSHCPKCGHDLSVPLEPKDLFGIGGGLSDEDIAEAMADAMFDDFWEHYPRKVGKPIAKKAFVKLKLTGEQMDQLLAALAVQKASDQWTQHGVQFVPHPATWLNQRRWEDDPEAYGAGQSGGRPGPAPRNPRVGLAPGQKLSADDSGRD